MPPRADDRDLGIVHLTDLHCPVSGSPGWRIALLDRLAELRQDGSVSIAGLAVTGDLVDSPRRAAFRRAAALIWEAAVTLGLATGVVARDAPAEAPPPDPASWQDAVWIVDGNHDYRLTGLLRRPKARGIEAGGFLRRLDLFSDVAGDFAVLGFDSASLGSLARGYVPRWQLDRLRDAPYAAAGGGSMRIALVHHHLLPLPAEPREAQGRLRRVQAMIFDAGTKLLSNSGLVTRRLLAAQFDVVLHGHEHQAFSATLRQVPDGAGRSMTVLGGVAAAQGFQMLRLAADGSVQLDRFLFDREQDEYRPLQRATIVDVEDRRRLEWEREAALRGSFDRLDVRRDMDALGDIEQRYRVSGIRGGERRRLHRVMFQPSASEEDLGTIALRRIVDLSGQTDPDATGEAAGWERKATRLRWLIRLRPPARADVPHPGMEAGTSHLNCFALTAREAALSRKPPVEHTDIHLRRPTRRVHFLMRFPGGFAPDQRALRLRAYRVEEDGQTREDTAETQRVAPRLIYDQGLGVAVLEVEWALPRFRYRIEWDLPDHGTGGDGTVDAPDVLGRATLRQLLAAGPAGLPGLNRLLMRLRGLEIAPLLNLGAGEEGRVDLAVWAFNEAEGVARIVAATHAPDQPHWQARLRWGDRAQGYALRRREAVFFDAYRSDARSERFGVHRPLPGCPPERFLFCIPVALPFDPAAPFRAVKPWPAPSVLVTLSGRDADSNMELLLAAPVGDKLTKALTAGVVVAMCRWLSNGTV